MLFTDKKFLTQDYLILPCFAGRIRWHDDASLDRLLHAQPRHMGQFGDSVEKDLCRHLS